MKKLLLIAFALTLVVSSAALADYTVSYGWEDGTGTTLGHFSGSTVVDNVPYELNVTGAIVGQSCQAGPFTCPGAFEGDRYLQTAESPHTGTPQIYIACITGLVNNDVVTASYWGYDITPDPDAPSLRIWAHYTDSQMCPACPGNYTGSASGPADYTAGTGWSQLSYTWTFLSSGDDYGLVIEARLYSTPSTLDPCLTDYFIDLVTVTAPDHAHVLLPDLTGPSAVDDTNWGGIKALFE
jgi:hypothetical protein